MLTHRLLFICLFVNVNEMVKCVRRFLKREKFGESAKPTLRKEVLKLIEMINECANAIIYLILLEFFVLFTIINRYQHTMVIHARNFRSTSSR